MSTVDDPPLSLADLDPPPIPAHRPILEREVRLLLELAVAKADREAPGDARFLDVLLGIVHRRWSEDWVTSFLGGGGGGGCLVDGDSLLVYWSTYPEDEWDLRLEYVDGRWVGTEWGPQWHEDDIADDDPSELVDAYLAALFFDSPNAYRWDLGRLGPSWRDT